MHDIRLRHYKREQRNARRMCNRGIRGIIYMLRYSDISERRIERRM